MAHRWARGVVWGWSSVWVLITLCLVFFVMVYAYHAWALVRFPFDYDQGEGYDVNSAWLLARGLPIYDSPDQYPFYSSNYPPVFSLLLAPLVGVFGPLLPLGRMLSIAATVAIALMIAYAVRDETGRWRPGLIAALMFFASPYVYHVTPLARVNALMVALALAGLLVAARAARTPGTGGRLLLTGAGALLLTALYAKQMSFDAVAAACLSVALRDLRRGILLGGGIVLVGGAIYLLLDWLTGGGFSLNVLWANANPFSVDQAIAYFRNFAEIHPLYIVGALVVTGARLRKWGPLGLPPASLYFLASLVVAAGTGKWGAGESYFLGTITAACILSGIALHSLDGLLARLVAGESARDARLATVLLVAVALLGAQQLRLVWHGPWSVPEWGAYDRGVQASVLSYRPKAKDVAAGERIASILAAIPGDVLSEESAFSLYAGKPVLGNATQQRNLYEAGLHNPTAMVQALERGDIGAVVLNAQQYPAPVLQAIGQNCFAIETVEMNGFHYMVLLSGRR